MEDNGATSSTPPSPPYGRKNPLTPTGERVQALAMTATSSHSARPMPAPADAPVGVIYAKPFTCRVCGKPIEHVSGGAWRHAKARSRS
jgi:hypothetical protein